jgi:small conductance mechanosensitive channel
MQPSREKGKNAMGEPLDALDQVRMTSIDLAMKFGPKVLVATLIVVAGLIAGKWAGGATSRVLERLQFDAPVRRLIERMVRVLVLVLFGMMALQNLGIELLPLIAGLGVAGAGVALAMQGVLANLVAGLTILVTRPFRIGDYVSMAKEEGEVLDITLAHTTLGHPDLSRVVIPNRKIVGEILHNFGKLRQLDVAVGVAYDTDLSAAVGTVREVLQANARVLREPAPVISVSKLADFSVRIAINPWVSVPDYVPATSEVNRAVVEAFRERNIRIALPQREVRLLNATA